MLFYFSHFGCGTGEIVTVDVSIYLHFVAFLPRSHSDLCRLMAVMVCKRSLTALIYISNCWSRPGIFWSDYYTATGCAWNLVLCQFIWWMEGNTGSLWQWGDTSISLCQLRFLLRISSCHEVICGQYFYFCGYIHTIASNCSLLSINYELHVFCQLQWH